MGFNPVLVASSGRRHGSEMKAAVHAQHRCTNLVFVGNIAIKQLAANVRLLGTRIRQIVENADTASSVEQRGRQMRANEARTASYKIECRRHTSLSNAGKHRVAKIPGGFNRRGRAAPMTLFCGRHGRA